MLTVKMETRHPVEGSFGSAFWAFCNHCVIMAAWTHEHRQISPKSESNIWLKTTLEPNNKDAARCWVPMLLPMLHQCLVSNELKQTVIGHSLVQAVKPK